MNPYEPMLRSAPAVCQRTLCWKLRTYSLAAVRGVVVSLFYPLTLAIAMRFHAVWVENVPLTVQLKYFGANYFCPACVFIALGTLAGAVAHEDVGSVSRRDLVFWSLVCGIGFLAMVISFRVFETFQGFNLLEHAVFSGMAYPNAVVAGTTSGRYVWRKRWKAGK